jgi:hypothetical protein
MNKNRYKDLVLKQLEPALAKILGFCEMYAVCFVGY